MKNISDVLSLDSTKFELVFGDETKEFHLNKFSIEIAVILEEEFEIPLEDLDKFMAKKPAKWGTLIGWLLLEEKDFFNNDINQFRRALNFSRLNSLTQAVYKTFENSNPKNEEAEALLKPVKRKK